MPTAFMSTSTVSKKGKCDSYVWRVLIRVLRGRG